MLIRVFTLRFNPASGRFDDTPVVEFLADKEVLSIDNHFFVREGTPYLVLVVCYRAQALPPAPPPTGGGQPRRSD